MSILATICVVFTWQGDCVQSVTFTASAPWSDASCVDALPERVRPFVLACTKVREVRT
ncbi:hypothetical protein [Tropicimonas sp. IMCC34011]|uniref:hypothetical protein n=1 Tax=Tropicimonas sp. IMCC34011 TaxID=2248759 RepID=UPI0013004DBB|nr:hypothetical protein [Tropicimonas sp. IMCC34011]